MGRQENIDFAQSVNPAHNFPKLEADDAFLNYDAPYREEEDSLPTLERASKKRFPLNPFLKQLEREKREAAISKRAEEGPDS